MSALPARELLGLWRMVVARLERPRLSLGVLGIGLAINLGVATVIPLLVGELLDGLALNGSLPLTKGLIAFTSAVALQVSLTGVLSYLLSGCQEAIGRRLRVDVALATMARGADGRPLDAGDATARVVSDTQKVQSSLGNVFLQPFVDIAGLALAAYLIIEASPIIGALTLASAPCAVWACRKISVRLSSNAASTQVAIGQMVRVVQSWLGRAQWVGVYGLARVAGDRVDSRSLDLANVGVAGARLRAQLEVAGLIITVLPQLVVLGAGGHMVKAAQLSVGELVALMGLSALVAPPMNRLVVLLTSVIPAVLPSYRRLSDVNPVGVEAPPERDAVRIDRLDVSQLEVDRLEGGELLQVPQFSASAGELVCIRGANGSGKSAFLFALLGLRPRRGTLRVYSAEGARPLERVDIGFSPAEPVLFEGTRSENVTLWSPAGTTHGLIQWGTSSSPEAPVRPDLGVQLSRGESQRLGVARALAFGRPIVALDEPTIGLDDTAVEELLALLQQQCSSRLTIVVTHDARVLARAGRIYETVQRGRRWVLAETAPTERSG